ncbi:MAG: hypothetical protein PHE27_04055, partial [Alphaproteobacteria bacterium]|nr:hypothetical protein [Alphaproteobacteria bacterium]
MAIRKTLLYRASALALLAAGLCPAIAFANPEGGSVSSGSASISSSGKTLTVDQTSDKAVLDWRG